MGDYLAGGLGILALFTYWIYVCEQNRKRRACMARHPSNYTG